MSDDVKALIAEANAVEEMSLQDDYAAGLIARLADALEAAQQAPAVDREALARLIDPWAWDYGNPASPAVQMSRSVALAKADATIASGVASGILQDAAEVEARGLEKAGAEVREWADSLDEHNSIDDMADALIAAGWRKMPSRDSIIREMAEVDEQTVDEASWKAMEYMYGPHADAILALMDGDNE